MDIRNGDTPLQEQALGAAGQVDYSGAAGWGDAVDRKRFLVGVHLNARQLAALERYRASLDDDVSRPQAIRSILTCWLKQNGHL
ncbi:hypothetical protein [Paragemmobacter straminiformis]|uniref:Uncharacterized protein n=1 Tax=Paragemmobacter straminiformis TaxID=2045119 RepID=A0A842I4T6_9RHOB|nr:hypothetical protein [Gemmobacter straminiformis]MBC2834144.1 hypothetical protein [Gemmobacter straminiformis]